MTASVALAKASSEVIGKQVSVTPSGGSGSNANIWVLQFALVRRGGGRAFLSSHPRFRAATFYTAA